MFDLQSVPVFIFANQAGLDMLETTLVALQDISLDKIFDESGRKTLCTDFAKLMQQVSLYEYCAFFLKLSFLRSFHCSFVSSIKVENQIPWDKIPHAFSSQGLGSFEVVDLAESLYCFFRRDLLTCQLGFACLQWGAMSHMNKPLDGKFFLEKTILFIALLSRL